MKAVEYYRVAIAAEACGLKRTTLQSAVERGDLAAQTLGCGLQVVRLADVKAWAKQPRKRGPKPLAVTEAIRRLVG